MCEHIAYVDMPLASCLQAKLAAVVKQRDAKDEELARERSKASRLERELKELRQQVSCS